MFHPDIKRKLKLRHIRRIYIPSGEFYTSRYIGSRDNYLVHKKINFGCRKSNNTVNSTDSKREIVLNVTVQMVRMCSLSISEWTVTYNPNRLVLAT